MARPEEHRARQAAAIDFCARFGLCARGPYRARLARSRQRRRHSIALALSHALVPLESWPRASIPGFLLLLIAGLLIPQLFRLVSEEVGARRKQWRGSGAACAYASARSWHFSARALTSTAAPSICCFPPNITGASRCLPAPSRHLRTLFDWRGVVSTDNTLEEIDVNLASAAPISIPTAASRTTSRPIRRSSKRQKTPPTARSISAIRASSRSPAWRIARMAIASNLRDLRFPAGDESAENIIVRVELERQLSDHAARSSASSANCRLRVDRDERRRLRLHSSAGAVCRISRLAI